MRHTRPYRWIIFLVMCNAASLDALAQAFANVPWEQNNIIAAKASQLYGELKMGINIRPVRKQADFIYLAFGYCKPTRKNAWRKFTPTLDMPATLTKQQQQVFANSGIDGLHAMKLGVGWNHWFNHIVGVYAQAGWGFIADLSRTDDLPSDITSQMDASQTKKTFIYNTVPVEAGFTINLWQHLHLEAGVTYMWKEIPIWTAGIGYAF